MAVPTEKAVMFVVLSMRKIKTMAGVLNVVKHNLRQKIIDQKEYINPELSGYNEYFGAQDAEEFKKTYNEKINEAHLKRKIQSNASRILEFVFSFSAGYANGWRNNRELKKKIDRYFNDCRQFVRDKYGDIIITAAVHFDETTPHIHILCIPLVRDVKRNGLKFSSSGLVGGREGLIALHNDFYEKTGKSYGLSRGVQGSRATHTDLKQYRVQEERKLAEADLKLKSTQTALEESQKKSWESEAVKARMMAIQSENMKRSAELSKKERALKELEEKARSGKAEIPAAPAVLNEKTAVSWQNSVQTFVNNLSLGFKSIVEKLQVAYQTLLKKYELLKKENTELKKRAEKAEKDLASKPIEEIMAGRKQAVPVTHNQQKDMRKR